MPHVFTGLEIMGNLLSAIWTYIYPLELSKRGTVLQRAPKHVVMDLPSLASTSNMGVSSVSSLRSWFSSLVYFILCI